MSQKSRKDCLAICGRSGIETLKSKLVQDGYMRGLLVLPEYYLPPQPIKFRPKPEIPPYNPQPLIDVYQETTLLGVGVIIETGNAINPPYSLSALGQFHFHIKFNLTGVQSNSAVGTMGTEQAIPVFLTGVQSSSSVGVFTFITAFHMLGTSSTSSVGTLGIGSGYGYPGYGQADYGGTSDAYSINSYGDYKYGGIY